MGVPGVSDASLCAVDGETTVGIGVEVEVGSRRDIGCNGRKKRGSGEQNNMGEGHLLVVDYQT